MFVSKCNVINPNLLPTFSKGIFFNGKIADKKYGAATRVWTHNLSVARRMLYQCATGANHTWASIFTHSPNYVVWGHYFIKKSATPVPTDRLYRGHLWHWRWLLVRVNEMSRDGNFLFPKLKPDIWLHCTKFGCAVPNVQIKALLVCLSPCSLHKLVACWTRTTLL